ncbi:conserved hypothetical protein [Ricinus communis]|uniref:Uncharacterized protein n=1 Tax=Ricinus communis TaxID=3988 RepID=B9SDU4_RICCO|nr:conserved hypothetical protein [Ricinus communis]
MKGIKCVINMIFLLVLRIMSIGSAELVVHGLGEARQIVPVGLSALGRSAGSLGEYIGSGGSFRTRGRGGFGNRSLISGSNTVPLRAKRPW